MSRIVMRPRRRRFRRRAAAARLFFQPTLLAIGIAWATGTCFAAGQPSIPSPASVEAAKFASDYAALFQDTERLAVKADLASRDANDPTSDDRHSLLHEIGQLDSKSQHAMAAVLQKNLEQIDREMATRLSSLEKENSELADTWRGVRTLRNEHMVKLFDLDAQKRVIGQFASLFNVNNRWLWVCGTFAIAMLIALYAHERRHQFRRLLWVRKTRFAIVLIALVCLIAIPTVPALLAFLFGNQVYESIAAMGAGGKQSPRNALAEEIEKLKQKQADSQKMLEGTKESKAAEQNRKQAIAAAFGPDSKIAAQWSSDRQLAQDLAVARRLQEGLAEKIKKDAADTKDLETKIKSHGLSVASLQREQQLIGGGLGAVMLAITGGTGVALVRLIRQRKQRVAEMCPRCTAVGKLRPVPSEAAEGSDHNLEEVRCVNVIRDEPYEECGFQFFSQYQDYAKLSFPTLGVAESGKTHAMAMVYRELNQGRYPEKVHFEKIKSTGSDAFDKLVDRILSHRIATSATLADGLPHPLVFNFRDRDPLGTSDIIINIFDYAGAITVNRSLSDFDRRRALRGNGFLFFLDPMEPSESQSAGLNSFRQDLRVLRKLRAGRRIHTPVALCLTKIDLLINAPYARTGNAINDFYSGLNRIDQSAATLSLDLIRRRSDQVAQLRDVIWPNWEIERQVQGLFGERFMFFPMTPVGLNELGEKDLNKRTINPYGILEPLMWLLHMNGYPVLAD
jgi:hypothetical protein